MDSHPSRRLALGQLGAFAISLKGAVPIGASSPEVNTQPDIKRIKIGQIGVSHAHANKLAAYRQSPDYEVVGIVEPNPALRKQAEKSPAFAGLPWLTLDQLLQDPDIQAVLVETRVKDLLENAERCIEAGKSVHIDKPAGDSLPQLQRILAKAAKKNLLVQMGYMYRYNPGVMLLREFLKKGWLGEVFEVHSVMSKVVDEKDRKGLAQFPGGMMFELGCHIMDLVIGILGKPQRVTPFNLHSSPLKDGLKDNALAVLEYPRASATLKSSALEVGGFERRHLVVCGTGGTFQIQPLDNPTARITLSRDQGPYKKGAQEIKFPAYTRYIADAQDMARILRGEKPNDFPPSHDLAVQETLLRACEMPLDP